MDPQISKQQMVYMFVFISFRPWKCFLHNDNVSIWLSFGLGNSYNLKLIDFHKILCFIDFVTLIKEMC